MRQFLALGIACVLLIGCSEGGAPGIGQSAGPFQVSLDTRPSPPVAGRVEFVVNVSKDGKAVTDATVTAATSMPEMNMSGGDVALTLSGSAYTGGLNLMAGEWKIVVKVSAGGESGETSYSFVVK
ncbi:MAG: FixH family protein [Fimbriimonadaceae bacterium]